MANEKPDTLSKLDPTSEPVVAFYLTQETDLPIKFQGEHQLVTIKTFSPSGRPVEKPALRVTFSHDQSLAEPVGLLGFGSDLRCHVLLPGDIANPVHCRVYAQLNSGPLAYLVDDSSAQGTQLDDDNTRDELSKLVQGRRQAAQGLRALIIGPYRFQVRPPDSDAEVRRRRDWFSLNKPIPVTLPMLARQLGGVQWNWLRREHVGEGGNAKVYKHMETSTALLIAIKVEETKDSQHKALVLKEVNLMKTLRHVSFCYQVRTFTYSLKPYLVDILFDDSDNKPLPTIFTAMPLYLGHLDYILPLPDMPTTERIMLQIAEGLRFMHSNLVLHRDLKPENILVVTPEHIKIADYGWAASLKDTNSLYGVCGTVSYCAPEALRTNEIHTPAIDVYSLGAVYYAILDRDKIKRGWVKRIFRGRTEIFNTVFENAGQSPPHRFPGLVQTMLDPNRKGRCSLDETIEILKAKKYDWTKQAPLKPMAEGTHLAAGCYGVQKTINTPRLQQTPFGKAKPKVNPPKPAPFAQDQRPEKRQNLHQAPVKQDPKNGRPVWKRQEAATPAPQVPPMQKPRSKPAHVQGVNFNAGLPSYEEATGQNPFAPLVRQGDKNKLLSHLRRQVKEPRLSRHPAFRSRNLAVNLHRANDAGVHRRHEPPARQAWRNKQLAELQRGAYGAAKGAYGAAKGTFDTAKGTFIFSRALLCLACDGLLTGGDRVFKMFNDNPAARQALDHAAVQMPTADIKLMASVQRQARRTQRSVRMCTDEDMLDRQLMLSRKR